MDIERLREQWERITHEGLMNGIPCREIVDALLATETGRTIIDRIAWEKNGDINNLVYRPQTIKDVLED
jgi:hypothetical protein